MGFFSFLGAFGGITAIFFWLLNQKSNNANFFSLYGTYMYLGACRCPLAIVQIPKRMGWHTALFRIKPYYHQGIFILHAEGFDPDIHTDPE